jgi:hypothetical protein
MALLLGEARASSLLRYLLDRGGDLVMPDSKGSTPLHDAAEGGAVPQLYEGFRGDHLCVS